MKKQTPVGVEDPEKPISLNFLMASGAVPSCRSTLSTLTTVESPCFTGFRFQAQYFFSKRLTHFFTPLLFTPPPL